MWGVGDGVGRKEWKGESGECCRKGGGEENGGEREGEKEGESKSVGVS